MHRFLGLTTLLVLLSGESICASAAGAPWSWIAPKPQGNEMRASAYDAQRDLTVVVGEYGTVMTRTGNGPWQVHEVRTAGRFSCITWTGTVFLAGSESGGLFRSLNGTTWSRIRFGQFSGGPNSPPSSSGAFWNLNGDQLISAIVTSDTGAATVALAGDSVWVSSDQERRTWKKHALPNSTRRWISYTDLEYGRGLFVAVGTRGTIVTSSNGTSWTTRTSGTRRELDSLAFNGTYFVALDARWMSRSSDEFNETDAQVVRSDNGTAWAPIEPNLPGYADDAEHVLAAGPRFLVHSAWATWLSEDHVTWTEVPHESGIRYYYRLQGAGPTSGGRFLIFTEKGNVFSLDLSAQSFSDEITDTGLRYGKSVGGLGDLLAGGGNWSALAGEAGSFIQPGEEDFRADNVFQQRGFFLLGVDGDYWNTKRFATLEKTSGSGSWLVRGSAAEMPGQVEALAAASSSGHAVCISREFSYDENDEQTSTYRIYFTYDWNTWQLQDTRQIAGYWPAKAQLEYDGKRFIVLLPGEGLRTLEISSEGALKWEDLPALPDDSDAFRQRFHGPSGYVTKANLPTDIASNGQRLVVASEKIRTDGNGYTYRQASVDGRFFVWDFASLTPSWREFITPWASIPDGIWNYGWRDDGPGRTIIWTGSRYISIPQEFTPMREPQSGRLFASADGENWTQHEMPTQAVRVAWTGSQLVAATENGGVLTHPDGVSPEIVSSLRIVSQPASIEAYNGETVTFEVVAQTELPGLAYQWFKDERAIRGANKSFLNVKCGTSTLGRYHVVLTAAEGAREVSAPAFLTLRPPATWQWQGGATGDRVVEVSPGSRLELALTNVQGPPGGRITYRWLKDGRAISGVTGPSLVLDNASPASAGVYAVEITTSAGKVTTEMIRVVVSDPSVLVYSMTGKADLRRSVGASVPSGKLSGHVVVDRSATNPRAAFVWIETRGSQSFYRTEEMEDAVMHSTGPGPNTMSVISRFSATGVYPREDRSLLWIAGTDGLVKLSNSASTMAPSNMTGWVNAIAHAQTGTLFHMVSVSLALDRTASANARTLGFAGSVDALEQALENRGVFPASD